MPKVKAVKLQSTNKSLTEGPATIEVETRPADPIEMVSNISVPAVVIKSEDIVKSREKKAKATAAVKEKKAAKVVEKLKKTVKSEEATKVVEKPVEPNSKLTPSQMWWNEIKTRKMGLFGLTELTVEHYCKYVPLDPNRCFISYDVSAVIPTLERVAPEYELELISKYVVLTKRVF